jgi:hypothetical protein
MRIAQAGTGAKSVFASFCRFGQKEGKKLTQAISRSMFVENKRTFYSYSKPLIRINNY